MAAHQAALAFQLQLEDFASSARIEAIDPLRPNTVSGGAYRSASTKWRFLRNTSCTAQETNLVAVVAVVGDMLLEGSLHHLARVIGYRVQFAARGARSPGSCRLAAAIWISLGES